MKLDLSRLFEAKAELSKYTNSREELEAIAQGTKAMSAFLFQSASIDSHPLYNELHQIASELNLSIIISNKLDLEQGSGLGMAYVFVTAHSEQWRVPAYISVQQIFDRYGWSNAAEHLESLLLGYSDKDVEEWLAAHFAARIGWTGKTFYLFLSSAQAASVRALGMHCIDPTTIVNPVQIFFNRKLNPIGRGIESIVSEEITLARVSVREPVFRELFGRQTMPNAPDVITGLLTPEMVVKLNSALESNFQFLENGSWR